MVLTSMAEQMHLEVEDLSSDVQEALTACAKRLESARFRHNGSYEIIDDRNKLEDATRDFIKLSAQAKKVNVSHQICRGI